MPAKRPAKEWTMTELGTLMEATRSEVRVVAEGVATLNGRVGRLEKGFDRVASEVSTLRDQVNVMLPMIQRNTKDIGEIKDELKAIRSDFGPRLKAVEDKVTAA